LQPGADRGNADGMRLRGHPVFARDAVLVRPRPQIMTVSGGWSSPVAVWPEIGLGICALLLPSLLALVPRGAAPLTAFAGLCAAGLVAATPPYRVAALRRPALLL